MHRILKKDQILTIPNLLSLIRIILIPVIVWLYMGKKMYAAATIVVVLSGLTDIADGFIARKFNMISDFGKILDPVADKLTQAAMLVCLVSRYPWMIPVLILFLVKEIIMAIVGMMVIHTRDIVDGAKWYGKANTVVLYSTVIILFLFPGIPVSIANVMIVACGITIAVSMILYLILFIKRLREK